jgi:transcriptional regulator of met regulon
MEYFFPGLHQPSDAKRFERAFISVNRLRGAKGRKSDFAVGDWIMDSGAFSEISKHGRYRHEVAEYAEQIARWATCGNLLAAVTQDFMCEPFILAKTGKTIPEHQALTVARYDELLRCETGVYIMPVLQGYEPRDYVHHIAMYGSRLPAGAWAGVGSVCKRNASPKKILDVLMAIAMVRPDLRLHGFGLKITALRNGLVRALLYSADSLAWSFAARKNGRNANDWREAETFRAQIAIRPEYQGHFVELERRWGYES